MAFLFVFFWDSYDLNVGAFDIVPEVSEAVLISLHSFSSLLHLFPPFYLPPHLSYLQLFYCLSYSTVGSLQTAFDIIYCIIHYWFFFPPMSLFNFSCIFSILVSRLFICTSTLFSKFWIFLLWLFWILFQLDSRSPPLLFGLVAFYHVPLPAEYISAFSSCLGSCVWDGLSVCWKFVVPLYCGGSSLWVRLDKWLVKFSWLGKLVCVFWLVELDPFSLECNEVSSHEFWDVYPFGVICGHLNFCAQGYAQVDSRDKSFLVFSSFAFRPLASGFQSYSYSSLNTSSSIQHRW